MNQKDAAARRIDADRFRTAWRQERTERLEAEEAEAKLRAGEDRADFEAWKANR